MEGEVEIRLLSAKRCWISVVSAAEVRLKKKNTASKLGVKSVNHL